MTQEHDNHNQAKKQLQHSRIRLTFLIFMFCTAAFILKACYFALCESKLKQSLRDKAKVERIITLPGKRGDIKDENGTLLAYSTCRLQVAWTIPSSLEKAQMQRKLLQAVPEYTLPHDETLASSLGKTRFIALDLPYDHPKTWQLTAKHDFISPRMSYKRIIVPNTPWTNLIGLTEIDQTTGIECGITGLELAYDSQLRGLPVSCTLLKDGRSAFMNTKHIQGTSVILPQFPDARQ